MSNFLDRLGLVALVGITTLSVFVCALVSYGVMTAWLGYDGGKSGVIYLGAAFFGYWVTTPLWNARSKKRSESD